MATDLINLSILLPFGVFTHAPGVTRVVVETHGGSFGLLPRRLDCVAALVPGILVYETEGGGEVYVAVDEGVLVKTGFEVQVSVRRALAGTDLAGLRDQVEASFLAEDAHERGVQAVMAKLESGFLRRFASLSHG